VCLSRNEVNHNFLSRCVLWLQGVSGAWPSSVWTPLTTLLVSPSLTEQIRYARQFHIKFRYFYCFYNFLSSSSCIPDMFISSAVGRCDLLLWSSGRIQHPGVAGRSRWIQRDLLNIAVTRWWWLLTEIHKQSSLAWSGSKELTRDKRICSRRGRFINP
jgi:hypothetical protein